jgi:hypothetical protein
LIVSGRFKLIGTHIVGFDEPDSSAFVLNPDHLGKDFPNVIRDNVFQRCARVVKENQPGLWEASHTEGNLFINCEETPKQ